MEYFDETLKCKKHPRYQAKLAPRATKLFPTGCPVCIRYFNYIQARDGASVKGSVPAGSYDRATYQLDDTGLRIETNRDNGPCYCETWTNGPSCTCPPRDVETCTKLELELLVELGARAQKLIAARENANQTQGQTSLAKQLSA